MAAPAGRALRQVALLCRISVTSARGVSGAGKGSPQYRASKTLVSFPVKFSAASQDSVISEGRSDALSKLIRPAASIALQELGDQGPGEHASGKSLGPEGKLHPGDEGSQEKVKSVGKGPEWDEDLSSSSSSDSEDEGDTGAQMKAAQEAPDVKENGFSSVHPEPKKPSGDLLNQDRMSSATIHPEIQPEEGISGNKTEPLIDHAHFIHAKGETQGEDSPQKTEVSAEIVSLTGSPGPEGAEIERSGPVVHSESQPAEESRIDDCEQLMDQAPVIHSEGLAQEKAPEKLGAPVGDVPLTEAPSPEGVEMERSRDDTKPSGEASPAAQSPAPQAEVCEANPVGTEEENATKSSAPPSPPPAAAAASVPPAVPVVEEAVFDNSKYQNLQHYSYTPYTFVDSDLELSKSRLPQPSAGRPSPRH